jgi:hypothetical protein
VSCRRPDGTSQETNRFVIGRVAVSAGGAFDLTWLISLVRDFWFVNGLIAFEGVAGVGASVPG